MKTVQFLEVKGVKMVSAKDFMELNSKYVKLCLACSKVIVAAAEAHFSMPQNKVVRMEMADLKDLRQLGAAIEDMKQQMNEWCD